MNNDRKDAQTTNPQAQVSVARFKEGMPVSVSENAGEYVRPSEAELEVTNELKDAGLRTVSEETVPDRAAVEAGVTPAHPQVSAVSGDKITLPAPLEEVKAQAKGNPSNSNTWFSVEALRQYFRSKIYGH